MSTAKRFLWAAALLVSACSARPALVEPIATVTAPDNAPNHPPLGALELVESSLGRSTAAKGAPLIVSGWAADWEDGAAGVLVQVLVDGDLAGITTTSGARPDVAANFLNPAFADAGWSLAIDTASLSGGGHSISAVAIDSAKQATTTGSLVVQIVNNAPVGRFEFSIGPLEADASYPNGVVQFGGWAADPEEGAPVLGRVEVFIDGVSLGVAQLGIPREDVAAYYSRSDFLLSGWALQKNIGPLTAGAHSVSAIAYDGLGASAVLGSRTLTVKADQPPFGALDSVSDVTSASAIVAQQDLIQASGWAADVDEGAPVLGG